MNLALIFHIAVTHVRHRARQTAVAMAGVATGVGFSIMMAALMEGSQRDFIATLVDTLPHIQISDEQRSAPPQPAELSFAAAEIQGLRPEDIRSGIKNSGALVAALEAWIPGAVTPSVRANAIIRYAGRDRTVNVIGIEPRRERQVSAPADDLLVGTLDSLATAANGMIIGDGLSERLGLRIGRTATLVPSTGQPIVASVVGVFHSGVTSVDEGQVYVLVRTAQVLWGRTGFVNEIRIRLQDAMRAGEIAPLVEAQTGYKSVPWQEAHEDLLSAFQIRNTIMLTVVGAILLVASFGTYNIVSTITHEKVRDIAILKSLGLSAGTVRRIFVLEGLVIGLAGALAGACLGYAMTRVLGTVEIRMAQLSDVSHLPVLITWRHYALAGAVAIGSSAAAAFFPARRAARLNPVDIIRGAQ
jgi:lipoprotein-releasing system permease protein